MNSIEIEGKRFYALKIQALQGHKFCDGETPEHCSVIFQYEPDTPLNDVIYKGGKGIEVRAGKPFFEHLARAFFNSEEIYVAFKPVSNEPARIAAILPKLRPIMG